MNDFDLDKFLATAFDDLQIKVVDPTERERALMAQMMQDLMQAMAEEDAKKN